MTGLQPCDLAVSGSVVAGGVGPRAGTVLVERGRVLAVVEPGTPFLARRHLDVGGALVLPGAVDAHVHCLSNPHEGVERATLAALCGGVTTLVEMPYDAGRPVWSRERLDAKRDLVAAQAWVDVALLGTVRPVDGASDVAELVEGGCAGFKLSLFDTDARRFPRIPDDQLVDVLAAIAAAGSLACFHAENDEIIKPAIERARRAGRVEPIDHCRTRPPVSETEAVLKALELSAAVGAAVHLCHLSLGRSVELAEWYRSAGQDVSMETCPHYLCFTEDDMARVGSTLKINPPLRSRRDQAALWDALRDGRVDIVASDHAPWPLEEKTRPDIFDNHSGVPGVETLVPTVLSEGLARGIAAETLVAALSTRPARRFGLATKGDLAPGCDADLVVFDRDAETVVDSTRLHSAAGWSPYAGRELRGRVTHVVSRGELVFDGEVHGHPGRGEVLDPRSTVAPPGRRDATGPVTR